MVFLRTTKGRIGYLHRSYDPWGPWQQFCLTDITSGESFNAFSKDLSLVAEIEQKELNSRFESLERERERIANEREEQELQERLAKHAAFVRRSGKAEDTYEPLVSLPLHGYMICNSCDSELSAALRIQCAECKWPICACGACRCGAAIKLHPEHIEGSWKSGITLDVQTLESHCVGDDEQGRPIFDTRRSELGELLYLFKYQYDQGALRHILALALDHLSKAKGRFDLIVPVPPSNVSRTVTRQIAEGLAAGLASTSSHTALVKTRSTDELKSVTHPDRRKALLAGAFAADSRQMGSKTVLLVDDLYRSGATLEAVTQAAYAQGAARAVYVFAVTRTRVHK